MLYEVITHRPLVDDLTGAVKQQWKLGRVVGRKYKNGVFILADIDCQHGDTRLSQTPPGTVHGRNLFPARRAPGGPEIDDHRAAPIIRETMQLANGIRQDEIRGWRPARHGSQRLVGNRHPAEQQQD